MESILLTGCNGYIGSRLLPALSTRARWVSGLDRAGAAPSGCRRFVSGDLLDGDALSRAIEGCDTVFHLAAAKADWGQSETDYFRDNVEATKRLIDAGSRAGVRDWVFFSSVAAMGHGDSPRDEDAPLRPVIPYGRSKAAGEQLFHELAVVNPGTRISIIRPSVVYGPGNPENTNVFRLIDAIHRRRFVMIGDGRVVKTTSYIDNLIEATLFLAERMTAGVHPFIYVDEPKLETREMTRRIHELLGRPVPRAWLPRSLAVPLALASDAVANLTRRDLPITSARIRKFCRPTDYDGSRIRRVGFVQPWTNEEALRATVSWYLGYLRSLAA